MKKIVLSRINIILGALIALLGVGCNTQKKAVHKKSVSEDNTPVKTIRVKYGVPLREDIKHQVDSIVNAAGDSIDEATIQEVYNIICMYGVPSVEKTDSVATDSIRKNQLNRAEEVDIDEDKDTTRQYIRVKYGVPNRRR